MNRQSMKAGTKLEAAADAARDAARDLVSTLLPVSQDLGCEGELEGILEIVEGASGADKQRAVLKERGSLEAVAANLVATTA